MFKRSLLFLAVCVGLAAHADDTTGKFALGLEVGPDFGNASGVSQVGSSTRTGYAAGVSTDIGINTILSIQPELLFVQEGTEASDANNVRIRTSFQSLRLPLMLKARLGEWKFAPYVFGGPMATYHLGSSVETVNANTSSNVRLKSWDFGVAGGVGVDVGPFFANARYDLGLTDLDENGAGLQSRGILVLAGLRI